MTKLPRNTFVSFGDIGNCPKSIKVYNINQIIGT